MNESKMEVYVKYQSPFFPIYLKIISNLLNLKYNKLIVEKNRYIILSNLNGDEMLTLGRKLYFILNFFDIRKIEFDY